MDRLSQVKCDSSSVVLKSSIRYRERMPALNPVLKRFGDNVRSRREESLVEPVWLAEVMREAGAIAGETDTLIAEQRARLQRGHE
jgi:hypothetical protein